MVLAPKNMLDQLKQIKRIKKIKKHFPPSQADRLAAWLAGGLTGLLTGWLAGRLASVASPPSSFPGWLAGWLVDWLAGWLTGWLAGGPSWLQGQKVIKSRLLELILPTSGAKIANSSNRDFWDWFCRLLEPTPESHQIESSGTDFVDSQSQSDKFIKSRLLRLILSTSGAQANKSLNQDFCFWFRRFLEPRSQVIKSRLLGLMLSMPENHQISISGIDFGDLRSQAPKAIKSWLFGLLLLTLGLTSRNYEIETSGTDFVDFWNQGREVFKSRSLGLTLSTSGAKARTSSNRDFCIWFWSTSAAYNIIRSKPLGIDFADSWSQGHELITSRLLGLILSTSAGKARKDIKSRCFFVEFRSHGQKVINRSFGDLFFDILQSIKTRLLGLILSTSGATTTKSSNRDLWDWLCQCQNIIESQLLGTILWTSAAKPRKSLNQDIWSQATKSSNHRNGFVDFLQPSQKVIKSWLLGLILPTCGDKATISSNQNFRYWFSRLLEPGPQTHQIQTSGIDVVHFWSQGQKVIKSELLDLLLVDFRNQGQKVIKSRLPNWLCRHLTPGPMNHQIQTSGVCFSNL